MENKLNIAEILKDCPKGIKLYSPIFGDVYLDGIRPYLAVVVKIPYKQKEEFLYDGRFGINGECMLFPSKENRDWSTFQRPFKDGDVVVDDSGAIFLYCQIHPHYEEQYADFYCGLTSQFRSFVIKTAEKQHCGKISSIRLATEEEKQKLFDAIRENGYKWNPENKTLEKLIEPKFKVGDRIKYRGGEIVYRVVHITEDSYILDNLCSIPISIEHMYNLVPNKFDIADLKPFESKVLIRDNGQEKWFPAIWGIYDKDCTEYPYKLVGCISRYCIPYEGNERLLGTTNDCDDYFKTWE